MSDNPVPIIDIARFLAGDPTARKAIPQAVARACEEIGFFTIVGHGIEPKLIAAAKDAANRFFDLPTAEKTTVRSSDAARSRTAVLAVRYCALTLLTERSRSDLALSNSVARVFLRATFAA